MIKIFDAMKNAMKKILPNSVLYYVYYGYLFEKALFSSPRGIHLEITWDCNLNCLMCPRFRAQPFKIKDKNLSLTEFERLIKKIPTLRHINIIGAGEPLVHPDFYEMLRIAKSNKITISFTTNGTLLDEKNIIRLPKNVDSIYFSIDSPNPDVYERIRGEIYPR